MKCTPLFKTLPFIPASLSIRHYYHRQIARGKELKYFSLLPAAFGGHLSYEGHGLRALEDEGSFSSVVSGDFWAAQILCPLE